MNEAMVYADGFEKTFSTAEEMLAFLTRRGKASEWIRKPIRSIRLVPLKKEAENLENGDEEMEEILKDTEKHTQLVLKVRGEAYPVRDCAIQTILGRAGISGDGLRKAGSDNLYKSCELLSESCKGGVASLRLQTAKYLQSTEEMPTITACWT